MSGTDVGYAATRLKGRLDLEAWELRACYAMSGTDVGYAAMRSRRSWRASACTRGAPRQLTIPSNHAVYGAVCVTFPEAASTVVACVLAGSIFGSDADGSRGVQLLADMCRGQLPAHVIAASGLPPLMGADVPFVGKGCHLWRKGAVSGEMVGDADT
eukprot:1101156-Rhodomonas_salina.1